MAKDLEQNFREQVGVRIRDLRRASGLSQAQAAAKTTMSVDGWSRLERGVAVNPALSAFVEVADALAVELQDLFPGGAGSSARAPVQELSNLLSAVDEGTQKALLEAVRGLLRRPTYPRRTTT